MQNERQTRYFFSLSIFFVLVLLISALILGIYEKYDKKFHFFVLDVGQGDAIYARLGFTDVLIDTGPDSESLLSELAKYKPFYDFKIDYVFITHPHADHIGGLPELINRYPIGQIYLTDAVSTSGNYKAFLGNAKDKNIPIALAEIKKQVVADEDFTFDILSPEKTEDENLNNTSIVMMLKYKNTKILLPGDAETPILDKLVSEYGYELKSDILKVSHHGSQNGTNEAFLTHVEPDVAAISLSTDNKFGFPHKETMGLLKKYDIKTLITGYDGSIRIVSDGLNYWLQ